MKSIFLPFIALAFLGHVSLTGEPIAFDDKEIAHRGGLGKSHGKAPIIILKCTS